MKKKYDVLILVALLVGINIYLIYRQQKNKAYLQKVCNYYEQIIAKDSLQNNRLKNLLEYSYLAKIELENPNIKRYFQEGEKVVLYVSENNCSSCIMEILAYIEHLGDKIGHDKIILIANFLSKEDFNVFSHNVSIYIRSNIFSTSLSLPEELKKQPLLFVANDEMKICLLYIPDYYPEYKEEYFTKILPQHFGEND